MATITVRELRRVAAEYGCIVTDDKIGATHECRVTAPQGKRFAEELHELIDSVYRPWKPDYAELINRIRSYGVETCDDPECDWCNDH